MKQTSLYHLLALIVAVVAIAGLLHLGSSLPAPAMVEGAAPAKAVAANTQAASAFDAFTGMS